MSRHDIGVAVRQRAAITRVSEDIMTSPLPQSRALDPLIVAREVELAKTKPQPHSDGASNGT
jgi:hypothetical protein